MKTPFRIKLILLWYKYVRKKVGFNTIKRISSNSKGVNNILFFLPAEKEFAQISAHFIKPNYKNDHLNRLIEKINFKKVIYCYLIHFHLPSVNMQYCHLLFES